MSTSVPSGRCRECGFDWDGFEPGSAAATLAGLPRRYRPGLTRLLAGEDAGILRRRPEPSTWSALEYAAHVRGVLALYDGRIRQVLAEGSPVLAPSRLDADPWEGQDPADGPAEVLAGIEEAAAALAATLEGVPTGGWERAGEREGERVTVAWMARQVAHEGHHHLLDLGRVLRRVREGA